ncbi:sam dependent methyltransferase [Diplogelasinospora grovesii]|uniref:Sam dependent methyltransferase n=1 Tax=Diplogelasinospora grovesii TaxID=303347 RepID=A0AAN6MWU7_9PEZI|nr:sam dependent methyltransferase [Diplogelasinospora grovesii]
MAPQCPHNSSLPSHQDGDAARLNLQHEAFRLILDDKLLKAHLQEADGDGAKHFDVLDIGSGTGIWAAEFAAKHANAQVLGIDLFEPSPTISASAPANCQFRVHDAEKDWDLPTDTLDLIHGRMVLFSFRDPYKILRKCFQSLKPGGVVEFQEMWHPYQADDNADQQTVTMRFSRKRLEAATKCGYDREFAGKLPAALAEAGFEDVQIFDYKFPIGPWVEGDERMRQVGEKYLQCLTWGMLGFSRTLFMQGLGWTEQQVLDAVNEVVNDLGKGKVYAPIRVAVARKPIAVGG